MKIKKISLCIIFGTSLSFFSHASDESFFISSQIGTLGAGGNIGYQFNDNFALRLNINGLKYHKDIDVNDLTYKGDIKLFTAGLLADYHPFNNPLRISFGAYYNDNNVSGYGHYSGNNFHGLNPNEFGKEYAEVSYNKFSPYLGIGYQSNDDDNWFFTADLGVMYQGKSNVKLNTVCYNQRVCSFLSAQITEENRKQKQDIERKANRLQFYPVASIGIGFRF